MRLPGEGQFRKEGAYHVWRLRRSGHKDVVRKSKSREKLLLEVDKVRAQIKEHGNVQSGAANIEKAMRHWLEVRIKPNRALKTYLSYEQTCRLYVFPAIGKVKASRLSSDHIELVIAYAKRKDVSDRTARYAASMLRRCFGKKISILLEHVELPNDSEPRDRVYSPEEIEAVLAEAYAQREMLSDGRPRALRHRAQKGDIYFIHRTRYLFSVLLNSGLRISECLGLSVFDFRQDPDDETKGMLDVSRQLEWKSRKLQAADEKAWEGRNWRLKPRLKNKQRRTVALTAEGVVAVREQLKLIKQEKQIAGRGYEDFGLLFPTERGTPQTIRNVTRDLERIILRTGIAHGTLHDFRRSYGTYFAKNEPRMHILAAQLGHANIATTAKYYTWAQDIEKAEAVSMLVIGKKQGHQERHQEPVEDEA